MTFFTRRRLRNVALTLAALVVVWLWTRWRQNALGRADFDTGYLLLASFCFLALYNVRKKLPVLPWTTSAAWLQTHIYVGLATAVVFGMHVGWRAPNGLLEAALATLYAAVFLSGLIGLYWTRTLPSKLARVSEEVIYERIPLLRAQVRDRAQQAVLTGVREAGATTLGEFFSAKLHRYFEQPRGWGFYLRPNNRVRKRLFAELGEVSRYLSDAERETSEKLFALVRRRDDLDYHEALQWRLKMWLFVHIGLSYPLLVLGCLHGWLAHLFGGGPL